MAKPKFKVGDRVRLVSGDYAPIGLHVGSIGTILGGNCRVLWVSWDGWANGHDISGLVSDRSGEPVYKGDLELIEPAYVLDQSAIDAEGCGSVFGIYHAEVA